MPWINKHDRMQYEHGLQELLPKLSTDKIGDTTYVLYEIVTRLFGRKRRWTTACLLLGSILGALLCFFVRHVWPYEKEKQWENGVTDGDMQVAGGRE